MKKFFQVICVLCFFVSVLATMSYATDPGPTIYSWPLGADPYFSTSTGWTVVNWDTTLDTTVNKANGFISGGYLYLSCTTGHSCSKCQTTNPISLYTTRCDGIYVVVHIVGEGTIYSGQFQAFVTDQDNTEFFRSGAASLDTTSLCLGSGQNMSLGFYFPTISQMYRTAKYLQLKYTQLPGVNTSSRMKIDGVDFYIVK